ncbi:MAG: hypothetical protein R3F59_33570 [Myxococcota bacterium]
MRALVLLLTAIGLLVASPAASARDVSLFSGDLAFLYGRNWGQQLNVAGLAGELKLDLVPQLAIGVRAGGALGGGIGVRGAERSARGYAGLPLLLKAEASPLSSRTRPYVGLAVGVTRAAGGGAMASIEQDAARTASWSVVGPMPTVMPEIGLDLGGFRMALVHASLVGSARAVEQSYEVTADGARTSARRAPGLSGTSLQVGVHFGGPKG